MKKKSKAKNFNWWPATTVGILFFISLIVVFTTTPIISGIRQTDSVSANNNLVQNDGFESSKNNWKFYTNRYATWDIIKPGYNSSSATRIAVSNAGTNTQLYQSNITIEPNKKYRLQFDSYNTKGSKVRISLIKHTPTYFSYGLSGYEVQLTNQWKKHSVEFMSKNITRTVSDARLRFSFEHVSQNQEQYYFDNITLYAISTPHPSPSIANRTSAPTPQSSNVTIPTTRPQPSSTQTATPTQQPSQSQQPLPLTQVDPTTNTDNAINNFLKAQVQQGNTRAVAAGAWWNPVDKFFDNQIWIVNQNTSSGKGFLVNQQVTNKVACILPGKTNQPNLAGKKAINTLNMKSSHINVPDFNGGDTKSLTNNQLQQFFDLNLTARFNGTSGTSGYTLASRCTALEGQANIWGDGAPRVGREINVQLREIISIGTTSRPGPRGFWNFRGIPVKYAPLEGRAWYEGMSYILGGIDSAVIEGVGEREATDLIGSTIKGKVTVYGYTERVTFSAQEAKSRVHHMELRIEQYDEDYTVDKLMSGPTEAPLGIEKQRRSFTLDTTKLTDGWHIMSWHWHGIDKSTTGSALGNPDKQLAGEIKFPVCVANKSSAGCP